jgi:GT2 family glycosyltransferase
MVACSVIVPTFNRADRLARCLEALAAQAHPDFEVIVVDDGSPKPVAPICEAFGPRVRCIRQQNAGPARARNTGAMAARGEFLAFTDDDCRPRPGWLVALHEAHGNQERRMIGGLVINGLPCNRYASASQALCDFLYDWFDASKGAMPFFTSNNLALSREGFVRLGGFDTTFERAAAEDRDLGLRWREQGGELAYAPDAVVDHYHEMSLRKFWRQHANYGAGAAHLHRVMRARDVPRPRFERAAFYLALLSWPIRRNGLARLDLAALIALSQVAMVAGYLEARKGQP